MHWLQYTVYYIALNCKLQAAIKMYKKKQLCTVSDLSFCLSFVESNRNSAKHISPNATETRMEIKKCSIFEYSMQIVFDLPLIGMKKFVVRIGFAQFTVHFQSLLLSVFWNGQWENRFSAKLLLITRSTRIVYLLLKRCSWATLIPQWKAAA